MNAVVDTRNIHSHLGPSGAHIWMNCAGAPNLKRRLNLPANEGSPEAALGTILHTITAECLLNDDVEPWEYAGKKFEQDGHEFTIDGDMAVLVEKNLSYVRNVFAQYESQGAILHVETRVKSDLDPDAFGTADIRIEVPGLCIIIIDFKYGMVRVNPDDEQLMQYGYMSYECRSAKMRGAGEPRIIEMIIAQPRLPNPKDHFRKHKMTPAALQTWFIEKCVPAYVRTRDPHAVLTMGEHCKFCSANTKGKCPAVFKEIEALPVGALPSTFTEQQLSDIMRKKGVINKFIAGIEAEAFDRAKNYGKHIPEYKVVHKTGHRFFREKARVDNGNGIEVLELHKEVDATIGDKAYEPRSIKSPAQIEKLPGGTRIVALFAAKPDTGLTLAPADDPREEAVGLMQRAVIQVGVAGESHVTF